MEYQDQQSRINSENSEFWSEMCGSQFAEYLGLTDHSKTSLDKFDSAFADYYPYLVKHLELDYLLGQSVLEIGLGFGTIGQMLINSGAQYHALDIALPPVEMMRHRFALSNIHGSAKQGNMLECPYDSGQFDRVISIGCFHHTGNMQRCVDETLRVLKPGGEARIMVYNAFSARQWRRWPLQTLKRLLRQYKLLKTTPSVSPEQRAAYDASVKDGQGAPETEFFSARDINRIFSKYSNVMVFRENFDPFIFPCPTPKVLISREWLLESFVTRWLGLDLYIHAVK